MHRLKMIFAAFLIFAVPAAQAEDVVPKLVWEPEEEQAKPEPIFSFSFFSSQAKKNEEQEKKKQDDATLQKMMERIKKNEPKVSTPFDVNAPLDTERFRTRSELVDAQYMQRFRPHAMEGLSKSQIRSVKQEQINRANESKVKLTNALNAHYAASGHPEKSLPIGVGSTAASGSPKPPAASTGGGRDVVPTGYVPRKEAPDTTPKKVFPLFY